MSRPSIGFFGLGTMGFAIAARLARAGFDVSVSDPKPDIVDRWRQAHGWVAHEAAAADVVVSCVTDEPAIEALLLGNNGLLEHARAQQLFIDHTTASPRFARTAATAAEDVGAQFVDAPISGGVAAAQAGTLSVFAGGSTAALSRAAQIVCHYASRVTPLGSAGAGQVGKLANQIAIAGNVRGLAEAVALGRAAQLDIQALLEALAVGSARSNQLEQHAAKLADPNFEFARTFEWLDKDLALALVEAGDRGAQLPQAALIKRLLEP